MGKEAGFKIDLCSLLQQRKLFRVRGHIRSHLWEGFVWTLKVKAINSNVVCRDNMVFHLPPYLGNVLWFLAASLDIWQHNWNDIFQGLRLYYLSYFLLGKLIVFTQVCDIPCKMWPRPSLKKGTPAVQCSWWLPNDSDLFRVVKYTFILVVSYVTTTSSHFSNIEWEVVVETRAF